MHSERKQAHTPIWPLQDAKSHFSEVIRATVKGPQFVSVRGEETAVILSKKEYDRLLGKKINFLEFVNSSPFKGLNLDIERDRSTDRDIEL